MSRHHYNYILQIYKRQEICFCKQELVTVGGILDNFHTTLRGGNLEDPG